ncbi:MAG: glycosyltransferase family 39 protein [Pedobacter sp.]|jgi:hypothetical protein
MSSYKRNPKEIQLILFFTILKLGIHLISNNNYGFHRDELLYMAMGEHLAWGFKEVPPFVAGTSWLSSVIFGDSVYAIRIFPVIASALIVWFAGLLVLIMNGKRLAIITTCLAMIISPAFLASGYLLQPVVFDQLFWVLSAYLFAKYIQTQQNTCIYLLGVSVGFGMLNKYTMAFFIVALIAGLAMSPQRKLLLNRTWIYAFFIAFLIFLPNILWQISHDLPFIAHMKELKEKQLNHINPTNFIIQILIIHASSSIIWLSGLFYLFVSKSNKRYQFLGLSFILLILILFILQGKVYYSFGAFPMLFAAGGICVQKLLNQVRPVFRYGIILLLLAPSFILIPIAIPVLKFSSALRFFEFTTSSGLTFPVRWEDQKEHSTTQDYADMLGWEEMAQYASKAYQLIPADQLAQTTIITGNYGQAGAVLHFRSKYHLPEPVCLNSSFALWAPDSIATRYLIIIDDSIDDISPAFGSSRKIGEINNPYAREKGTSIYLLSDPKIDIHPIYNKKRLEALDYQQK